MVEPETSTPASRKSGPRHRFQRARAARFWVFGMALAVAGLDQVVKRLVDDTLTPGGSAEIGPVFTITRVSNPGVNFGLLRDHPTPILYVTLAIGLLLAAYVALHPPRQWWPSAGFALLLGGAFGNVIDRIRLGWVFDYLNITPFVGFLNLADLAIGAGFIMLIIDRFRSTRPDNADTTPDDGDSEPVAPLA